MLCAGLLECPPAAIEETPFPLFSAGCHGSCPPGAWPSSPPHLRLQPAQGSLHLPPLLSHWLCPLSCSFQVDRLNQHRYNPQVQLHVFISLSTSPEIPIQILQLLIPSAWLQQGLFFTYSPKTMASLPLWSQGMIKGCTLN